MHTHIRTSGSFASSFDTQRDLRNRDDRERVFRSPSAPPRYYVPGAHPPPFVAPRPRRAAIDDINVVRPFVARADRNRRFAASGPALAAVFRPAAPEEGSRHRWKRCVG